MLRLNYLLRLWVQRKDSTIRHKHTTWTFKPVAKHVHLFPLPTQSSHKDNSCLHVKARVKKRKEKLAFVSHLSTLFIRNAFHHVATEKVDFKIFSSAVEYIDSTTSIPFPNIF